MDLNLAGKVAVVTGAGKGIGMAATLALADEGAHVITGSRTTGTLDGLKGVTPVAVDLTAADGPAQLIRHATEEHGRIECWSTTSEPSACVPRDSSAPATRTSPGRCR